MASGRMGRLSDDGLESQSRAGARTPGVSGEAGSKGGAPARDVLGSGPRIHDEKAEARRTEAKPPPKRTRRVRCHGKAPVGHTDLEE